MIFTSLPRCHNMLSNMLTPLPEASSRLHGYATIVEGMDIYDLFAIGCMDILMFLQKHRYLKQKLIEKKEWKIKKEVPALIAHTSLRVSSKEDWYFDSGCSRHMTGMKNYLVDVKAYA